MPWRVTEVSNERMRFVLRHERGERMSDLCREFGISRKTGYKFWNRYKDMGPEGLGDFSRRPKRHPSRIPREVEELVVEAKRRYPTWGPKKLRVVLSEEHPGVKIPAASTIGEILKKAGLVQGGRRRRRCCSPTPPEELSEALSPNEVWCADFKGEFRMGDGNYCYPLTVTDQFSRFLLSCAALESTRVTGVYGPMEEAFREYGIPKVIRTDNGAPFASTGLRGLSRLSVWWLRLGIQLERIEPGHPEQNGRHERMHLTLKEETTRPAGANLLQQQERFDRFRTMFNEIRPHEALGMRRPSDVYFRSETHFPEYLETPNYPLHDEIKQVSCSGQIEMRDHRPFISKSLAGEYVGLRELQNGEWLVSFMELDLGVIDEGQKRFKPLEIYGE